MYKEQIYQHLQIESISLVFITRLSGNIFKRFAYKNSSHDTLVLIAISFSRSIVVCLYEKSDSWTPRIYPDVIPKYFNIAL